MDLMFHRHHLSMIVEVKVMDFHENIEHDDELDVDEHVSIGCTYLKYYSFETFSNIESIVPVSC